MTIPANAQNITGLYNTGVTNTNALAAGGTVDLHYRLLSSTDPAYSGSNMDAYVTSQIPTEWMGNTSLAK